MTPTGLEEAAYLLEIPYCKPKSDAKSDAEVKSMLKLAVSDDSFKQLFTMWCILSPSQKQEVLSTTSKLVVDGDFVGTTSTKLKDLP